MRDQVLVQRYWDDWIALCPSAPKILQMLESRGERVVNDHIALRTLSEPSCNISVLAKPFLNIGYKAAGEYNFAAKKLYAQHFEKEGDPFAPKIFISELRLELLSASTREVLKALLPSRLPSVDDLGRSGRSWDFSRAVYDTLYAESEYGAWFYAFGFRANHFTILLNSLRGSPNLTEFNSLLKDNGFVLNSSGGEIKGSPELFLEQSSTMADQVEVIDQGGVGHRLPGCYFEFAKRYVMPSGQLYQGFVTSSADKIFESTN